MSQAYYINRHEERDGEVTLFHRQNAKKPTWHMRLYVKGMKNADNSKQQYIQRSTGTTNKAEAIRIALEEHDTLRYKVRHKKPATDITFKDLYDLWWLSDKRQALEKTHRQKNRAGKSSRITWYERYSERYWIPYFGKYLLNDVDNTVVRDYWKWREDYWQNATEEERNK